jgi:hypothetical protein
LVDHVDERALQRDPRVEDGDEALLIVRVALRRKYPDE